MARPGRKARSARDLTTPASGPSTWEGIISTRVERVRRALVTPWVRTVAVLTFTQVVTELAFGFALPFTPLYIQQLGVTDLDEVALWAGLIAGVNGLAMGVMAPIWGIVADRYGHRLMIQRATFGAGIAIALIAFVQSPGQMLVLRIFHGIFTGVVAAIATLASLSVPRHHLGTVLGMLQAAMFTGGSLGPLLGGAFADLFGLRVGFFATGAILCLAGLLVTLCVAESPRRPRRAEPETPRSAPDSGPSTDPNMAPHPASDVRRQPGLFRRDVIVVVGLMALTRFAMTAPQPFVPLFVQQLVSSQEGLATTVGLVLAATGLASTISALLVGRLVSRFGQRMTLVGSLLLAAVFSALHAGVGSVWQLVALRTALGLAQGGTIPSIQALLIDVTPPSRRGAAFGLLTMANSAGNGGGPVLGSVVMAGFGVQAVFLSTAPAFGLAAWVVARLRPRSAAHGQPSTAPNEPPAAPALQPGHLQTAERPTDAGRHPGSGRPITAPDEPPAPSRMNST